MKLAIKGHPTRRKDVLNILKSLGGNDSTLNRYSGGYTENLYYVGEKGDIIYGWAQNPIYQTTHKIYTLEEFEARYPYKVGEKVLYLNNYLTWIEGVIDKMDWDETNNTLYYHVNNINGTIAGLVTTSFLKSMKKKELKDYLKPGYVVEYDNGNKFVITQDVHGNTFGIQLGKAVLWASLTDLDSIAKVYQVDKPGGLHLSYICNSNLTLVWERKEVELTMQQIADKFGINVNQLKIKK